MLSPITRRRRAGRAVLNALPYCFMVAALLSSLVFAFAADTAESKSIATISSTSEELSAQLSAAGVSCSPSDFISEGRSSGVFTLWVSPSSHVSVSCGSASWTLTSFGETVGALLARLDLTVGEHDLLIAGRTFAASQFQITLIRRTVESLTNQEPIPRPVTRIANEALYQTQETVINEGSDGVRICTYETVTLNDSYARRTLLDTQVLTEPVAQVVEYGTKELPALSPLSMSSDFPVSMAEDGTGGGLITTLSGQQLAYTRVLTVKAYAYTTENKINTLTAIGTTARVGAIAVDPKVIPYGTRMFIQTATGSIIYGIATAEDCGNFTGNVIDLFYNTRDECLEFGRRTCSVYILAE